MALALFGSLLFGVLAANAFFNNDLQAASLYGIIALIMETRVHLFRIENKLRIDSGTEGI